jgi:hypothetical protein
VTTYRIHFDTSDRQSAVLPLEQAIEIVKENRADTALYAQTREGAWVVGTVEVE